MITSTPATLIEELRFCQIHKSPSDLIVCASCWDIWHKTDVLFQFELLRLVEKTIVDFVFAYHYFRCLVHTKFSKIPPSVSNTGKLDE